MIGEIEISNIIESSEFPVVDFKLKNGGKGKSLIRNFNIYIDSIEVDVTPVIQGNARIVSSEKNYEKFDGGGIQGDLRIDLENNGWGAAIDFEISLPPPMSRFFPGCSRKKVSMINSGIVLSSVINLASSEIDNSALVEEKHIEELKANIRFVDQLGVVHNKEIDISLKNLPGYRGRLYLERYGFKWIYSMDYKVYCRSTPEAIYYVCLEPGKGITQKSYKMSHIISSGDIEHFSIMIGSKKSCRVILRFEFDIDGDKKVCSNNFEIEIFKPRNTGYKYCAEDGDDLIFELKKRMVMSKNSIGNEYGDYSLKPDYFPFLKSPTSTNKK